MSLTKQQIHFLAGEITPLVQNAQFKQFYRTVDDHYILRLEKEFRHYTLLFCFKTPFVRFHLIEKMPKGVEDPFSDFVNKHLEGSMLVKLEALNEDRIVQWVFKGERQLSLLGEFFSKKANLFLLGKDNSILRSLNATEVINYHLPESPVNLTGKSASPDICLTNKQVDGFYHDLEQKAAFQKEKNSALESVKQKLKRSHKKRLELFSQLKLAQSWQTLQHQAELLLSNMYRWKAGMDKILVLDWENNGTELSIDLDPSIPLSNEIAIRFRKSKKLKASIPYIQGHLLKIESIISECESYLAQVGAYTTFAELDGFKKHSGFQKQAVLTRVEVKEKRAQPYLEYKSASNLSIWVGKSAKDNEKLTFSLSKGSDWWLHVQGFPGSHVIVRVIKNAEPDSEALKDAMQLAIAYSKAKDKGEADIVVTQRKFVSRFGKGQAGKVQISKHKVMKAKFDPARFQQIKERTN